MTAIHLPLQRPAPGPASADAAPAGEPTWSRVLVVAGSRAALAAVLSLVIWAVLPAALGWSPRVIMSGSMLPRIEVGDVVVDRPVDPADLTEGRIITVTDPDHPEKTRTHRFQERDEQGMLVTKGDANAAADSTPVDPDDVLGIAVLRVPYVGLPMTWMAQGQLAPVGIAVTVLLLGLAATAPLRLAAQTGDESDGDDQDTPTGDGPQARADAGLDILVAGASAAELSARPRRGSDSLTRVARPSRVLPRRLVGGLGVVLGAVLTVALTTQSTYAAFSSRTPNPASSFRSAAVFSAYEATVLGDSPRFLWRLNETAGTSVADASGNNRGGLITGDVALGVAGALVNEPFATAARFNGGTVLSSGSAAPVGTAFSVELWVRSQNAGGGPLLALTGAANDGIVERALYLGNDGIVRFGRSGSSRVDGTRIDDGRWHHVVYTNANTGNPQNQRARLYVDGARVDTGSAVTQAVTGYWDAGRSTFTGNWTGRPGNTFRGDLDEIAVYDDVLTATEVAEHYDASR